MMYSDKFELELLFSQMCIKEQYNIDWGVWLGSHEIRLFSTVSLSIVNQYFYLI